ncbi:MAG: zf-HC2 domain-containing protein [Acidobacteria bacterium]|nr:zf-HC2 domain-containing protein [Acidobacteriota bacterium]
MNCDEARGLIQCYLDNELDELNTLDLLKHLEACARCPELLDSLMSQDRLLKQSALAQEVNSGPVRAKVLTLLRAHASQPSRFPFHLTRLRRFVAVASLAAIGVLVWLFGPEFKSFHEKAYAAIVADHADHCSYEETKDARSSRTELDRLVAQYGKLSNTPDLTPFGYDEPHAFVCKIEEIQYLHLIYYRQKGQPLSVFMRLTDASSESLQVALRRRDRFVIASAWKSGAELFVVSSLADQETSDIARAIVARL